MHEMASMQDDGDAYRLAILFSWLVAEPVCEDEGKRMGGK